MKPEEYLSDKVGSVVISSNKVYNERLIRYRNKDSLDFIKELDTLLMKYRVSIIFDDDEVYAYRAGSKETEIDICLGQDYTVQSNDNRN